MGEEIVPIIIVPVIFGSIVWLIKIISDNKIRSKVIEKGLLDENIKYLYFNKPVSNIPSALKWGMVLIGVGLAFLIGQLVPSDIQGQVTVGSMFFLAGLGLVVYYLIAKKMMGESGEEKSSKQ